VLIVITKYQAHLAIVVVECQLCATLSAALPPIPGSRRATALQQRKVMDVGHRRALDFYRIILLRFGAVIGQVIAGKIDPADERDRAVDHHDLAMQAAKPVGADAQPFRRRVEHLQMHTGLAECSEVASGQLAATETVEAHGGAHATLRGIDQDLLEFIADLVFEHDERFEEDFVLRRPQRSEYAGKIVFAIFQKLDPIVALPAVLDIDNAGFAYRLGGGQALNRSFLQRRTAHNSISTDSGTWSERCDQGRLAKTFGSLAFRLRT
jgi:hypothetical protein